MLNVLRDNLKSLKWVLWIVAISMTLYLGTFFFNDSGRRGTSADWAARVDGDAISTAKLGQAVRRMEDYYRQMMGDRFEQLRPQLKLASQAVNALVDERVQVHEAQKLGLGASADEIAGYIRNDPHLKDPASGQFIGTEKYSQLMQRNWPGGVEDYEKTIGEVLTIQKWSDLTTEAVGATDGELDEAYRSRADRTKIDYVLLPSAGQKIDTSVSDAEVATWYRTHSEDYRRGEAKKVRFLVVERQAQAAKIEVTDQDVQAFYDANQAQLSKQPSGPPPLEQVKEAIKRQLQLQRAQEKVTAEAERIRAELKSASDLDAVAAKEGLKVEERTIARDDHATDLGASPQFLDAVFSVAQGAVSDPVGLARGMAILTPQGDPIPPGIRPLDEVKDRVRSDVLNSRTREASRSAAASALAKNKTLPDAAKALALEVKKDQTLVPGQPLPGSGGKSPELDKALFGSTPAVGATGVVPVPSGAVIYEVKEVERYSAAAFAAQKETLRQEVLNQKKSVLLQGLMEKLRQKHQIEINQDLVESLSR